MKTNSILSVEQNIISRNTLLYYLNYIIIIAIITLMWRIPQGGILKIIPFIGVVGFQKMSIIVTIFTIVHLYSKKVNIVDFYGSKYFIFFCMGILISFLLGAYENTLAEHIRLNYASNSLEIYTILKGFFLFVTIIVFFRDRLLFNKFNKIFVVFAAFLSCIILIGYAENFLDLFGGLQNPYDYYNFSLVGSTIRFTFPTMDNNTFGGIIGGVVILSLYLGAVKKNNFYSYILPLFFSLTVFLSLGRANSLKLVISLIVFFSVYYKLKLKSVLTIFMMLIAIYYFVIETSSGFILLERWEQFYYNVIPLLKGESRLLAVDNFTWRILAVIYGFPTTLFGWIFGSGGIQMGFVRDINSASHIEFANWLSEYGLITLLPLLFFMGKNIVYLLRIKSADYDNDNKRKLELYKATGLALSVGLIIECLNSPLFIGLWFWLGIINVIVLQSMYILDINKIRTISSNA